MEVFKTTISKLITEGERNFAVFTHKASNRFVQFIGIRGDSVVTCDIPAAEISSDQSKSMIFLLFSEHYDRDDISYRKDVEVQECPKLTEEIFRTVFKLSEDYEIEVELRLDAW